MKRVLITLNALVSCCMLRAATEVVNITAADSPVDIVARQYNDHTGGTETKVNVAGHMLSLSGTGVTVKLDPSAASDGVFTLWANINSPDNGFTLDATGIETIRWVGGVSSAGPVVIKGAKSVVFGEMGVIDNINTSYFDADFSFESAEATGVSFVNALTCARLPSCSYTIADGAIIAVCGEKIVGGGADAFDLSRYDFVALNAVAIDAKKVVIGNGRFLRFRPCNVSIKSGIWSWVATSGKYLANDVECLAGGQLLAQGTKPINGFSGAVSGAGDVVLTVSDSDHSGQPAKFEICGGISITGKLSLKSYTEAVFSEGTTCSIGTVSAEQATLGGLSCAAGASVEIGSVSFLNANCRLPLSGDATGSFTFDSIGDVSSVVIRDAVPVCIKSAPVTASVVLDGEGPWCLIGPSAGGALALPIVHPQTSGHGIELGGRLSLGDLGAIYSRVTLLSGAQIYADFDSSTMFSGSGRVIGTRTSWKDKVALWLDASDAESFELAEDAECWKGATASYYRDGNPIIYRWNDCRSSQTRFFLHNHRAGDALSNFNTDAVRALLPSYSTNETVSASGMGYVNMNTDSGHSQIREISSGSKKTVAISTKYAILVYGSQGGGGGAFLGATNGELARTAFDTTKQSNAGNLAGVGLMTNTAYSVYENGALVADPTTKLFSGGWDVFSIDFGAEGVDINGFGLALRGNTNQPGGRGSVNYAEAMLFSEAPTETERKIVEEYLAAKWKLPCAHAGTGIALERGFSLKSPSFAPVLDFSGDDTVYALTVNLEFVAKPAAGRYALAGNVVAASWNLGTVSGLGNRNVKLSYDADEKTLYADVMGNGLMLLLK